MLLYSFTYGGDMIFFYQRVQYSNSLISTICSIDSKTTKTTKSILSISYPFRSFFPWILACRYTYIHFSGTRECIFQCSYRANGHTWTAQRKAYWHPLTWVLIKATPSPKPIFVVSIIHKPDGFFSVKFQMISNDLVLERLVNVDNSRN